MAPDSIGYGNLNFPVSILFGKSIEETLAPQDASNMVYGNAPLNSSFVLTAETVSINILRCIAYNKIAC